MIKINRNTYYIKAPTNVGVFTFKNKNCLIIDSGINTSAAKNIEKDIISNGFHPKYLINTHSHLDHCGGNFYFQNTYLGMETFASEEAKVFIETPYLNEMVVSTAYPLKKMILAKKTKINTILEEGIYKINDEKIKIINLKGHTMGDIGIITPDRVCFLGDSIFSNETLIKYPLTFLINIDKRIETLEKIKKIDADFFLISHANNILNKNEIIELVDKNIESINKTLKDIMDLLSQPMTKEELLQSFLILNEIEVRYKEYLVDFSSISAYLNYLMELNEVEISIQDGKVYYYKN